MKKSHDSKVKRPVALEALRGNLTVAEIAGKYQIHPNQVQQWKKKLLKGASEIFQSKAERKENKPYTEDDLMKKIGRRMKFISELVIGIQWDIVNQGALYQSFNKSCPT